MSQSANHASAFYREVAAGRVLWTLQDEDGIPAAFLASSRRSIPFWSSLFRVEHMVSRLAAYSKYWPLEVSWDEFRTLSVPDIAAEGRLVGVNWSGPRAVGFDMDPEQVVANVQAQMDLLLAEAPLLGESA